MREILGERLLRSIVPVYVTLLAGTLVVITWFFFSQKFFLALLFGPLVSIFSAELCLRLTLRFLFGSQYMNRTRPFLLIDDKYFGYKLRGNVRLHDLRLRVHEKYAFNPLSGERIELSTNSLGFRGREFSPRKGENVYRIFCSGGSSTAGYGVGDGETWPVLLEKKLNAKKSSSDKIFEVINGGVYGWNSYQEMMRIKREIVNYNPDLILLHQGWNEEFVYSTMVAGGAWRPDIVGRYIDRYYFYSENFPVPSWLLSGVLVFKALRRDRFLASRLSFAHSQRWKSLEVPDYLRAWHDNIVQIAQTCNGIGVPVVMIRPPSLVSLADSEEDRMTFEAKTRLSPPQSEYQAIARGRIDEFLTALEKHVGVLNVTDSFNCLPAQEKMGLFFDEIHLSAEGEALLAQRIFEEVCERALGADWREVDIEGLTNMKPGVGINSSDLEFRLRHARLKTVGDLFARTPAEEIPGDRYTTY